MRISTRGYLDDLRSNLARATQDLRRLSQQLSSGKRLTRPSDDPLAVADIVYARADLDRVVSRQQVLQKGMRLTGVADVALDSVCSALRHAQEIVVGATQPGLTESARAAMAEEIRSVRARLFDQANVSVQGEYVFAGRNTRERPFEEAGGVVTYTGTSEGVELFVAPERPLEVTLPGDGLFNFEDVGGIRAVPEVDTDLFALLGDLATEIEEGDDSLIEQGMTDLQKLYEHVVQQRGVLGARTVRLEQAQTAPRTRKCMRARSWRTSRPWTSYRRSWRCKAWRSATRRPWRRPPSWRRCPRSSSWRGDRSGRRAQVLRAGPHQARPAPVSLLPTRAVTRP